MKRKPWMLALLAALLASGALAQTNPNTFINQRKGAMNLQAKYFGPLYGMAAGRMPYDSRLAQRNADYLFVITQLAWDDFQPGTFGLANTRAKEDILKDPAAFKKRVDALQGEIPKLQAAAKGGDAGALKSAVQGVASTCNGCHEQFSTMNFRFAALQ